MTAPYIFPPAADQTRIVAEVERRLSVVEELEPVVTPTASPNPSSKKHSSAN
jgi:hypothetical protein